MTILLRVDNFDAMPDGGPTYYQSDRRGFDVGRDTHLDWTLPDPNRHVSGKHCEVRFEDGGYALYDVSTNGTFLNGAGDRVKSPYRLRNGDRLTIGHYVISVEISGIDEAAGAAEAPQAAPQTPDPAAEAWTPAPQPAAFESNDIWANDSAAPAPIDRRDLVPPKQRAPREAGFESQYVELPQTFENPQAFGGTPDPAPPGSAAWGAPAPVPQPSAPQSATPQAPAQQTPAPPPGSRPTTDNPAGFAALGGGESEPFAPPPVGAGASAATPGPEPAAAPPVPPAPVPPASIPAAPVAAPPAPAPAAPTPSPAPDPVYQAAPQASGPAGDFIQHFARGARVNPADFAHLDQGALAEEVGAVMRIVVERLAVLLAARAKAKSITKSANRTMLAADDNNPLKFLPSADEILTVMFTRSRRGFKDAGGSVTEAFGDLERHEFATIFAMQKALGRLLEDMAPDAIEAEISSSVFSLPQSKAWQLYQKRWEDKSERHENGILDEFLNHFAEFYDQQNKA
ncbi:MAG: type VI secretion system-associated FHA domain protein TagH [Pseudomonadota bacterium]